MMFVTLPNVTECSDANPAGNIEVEVVEMLLRPGKGRVPFPVGRHRWAHLYKLNKIITSVSQ